jgi:diguanylate cyclase (GGDEF)-like protein/PAS domain S-box-containing protein
MQVPAAMGLQPRAGALPRREADADADVLAERWRLACGETPLGAFELDRSGALVASRELRDLCHVRAGESIQSLAELVEYVHVEDRPAVFNTLLAPLGAGSNVDVPLRLRIPSGDLRGVRIRGTWIGLPLSPVLVAVIVDDTESEAARLTDLAQRYQTLAEVSPDIIVVHQGGKVVYVNPAAVRHIGATSAEELIGQPIINFFSPASRQAFVERLSAMSETQSVAAFFEEQLVALDGSLVDVEATSILTTWEGRPAFQAVARVITERKAAEAERTALEQRHAAVVAALEEGIVVIGQDGSVEAANSAAERILRASPGSLIGQDSAMPGRRIVDEHGTEVAAEDFPTFVALRTGVPQTNVVLGLDVGKDIAWVSINAVALPARPGRGQAVVCSISDITEAKVAADRLAYMASHDILTDVANRAGVTYELEVLGRERPLAVLFIDLDRFKLINDSMGHTAGDQVLKQVAARLRLGARAVDVVGRLAGDEFVVLCPGLSSRRAATAMAHRLLARLDEPMTVVDGRGAERLVNVSASVGIAFVKRDEPATKVLAEADVAMYLAKERGRSRVEVFDNRMRAQARSHVEIQEDLRTAIDEGGLSLAYQPVVDRSGQIKGYEALARWHHPIRGVMSPVEFIPIAEDTGLIGALGTWVLAEAAASAAGWRQRGADVYISVNLSARQLSDPELLATVTNVLEHSGLEPSALCLEITESSVMADPEHAAATLAELKKLGVMLAIDDFGTGHSSLAYLQQFPLDILKVDRSFVSGLDGNGTGVDTAGSHSIVVAIVSLAHALGLSVTAEGVETPGQAAILTELDVDGMQGYLYGRPRPAPI